MRASAILAALSFAATTLAEGVPEGIAPSVSWPPEGCQKTSKYNFTIGYEPAPAAKRETAQEAQDSLFAIGLKDGILKDGYNRVGSIVANRQFQFDGPPQAGAIYTGGFSVCSNKSLALGDSTIWYKCGSGSFYNLYDQWIGGQCDEIRIVVSYVGVPSSTSSSATPSKTSSTAAASSSSASASFTLSATPLTSINGTQTTAVSSSFDSAPASASASASATSSSASKAPDAPPESTGGAVPTRVPRRETFGAVIGILGAALIL